MFVLSYPTGSLSREGVAIPFSSGLCSFPMNIQSQSMASKSQSLFHQVCVRSYSEERIAAVSEGRNPFFIRSVFVLCTSLNCVEREGVAIPFSSGLCSFRGGAGRPVPPLQRSQSLFHQVCVRSLGGLGTLRMGTRRNPFFIRSVFVQRGTARPGWQGFVAIPFSSGLCSFSLYS